MEPRLRNLSLFLKKHPKNLQKMVWVTGPRQVGKTTLLQSWPREFALEPSYMLNWDVPEDRRILRAKDLSFFRERVAQSSTLPFFLFDEIHKYTRWKKLLKGLFDALKGKAYFAVTGSARLDTYRRGGDSLLGRYWLFHLDPLTVAEVTKGSSFTIPSRWADRKSAIVREVYDRLFQHGGFPEPYNEPDSTGHARWAQLRREILVKEDLRDLSRISELSGVEHLMEILPHKVGSPLSVNSLREDLEVSHPTVTNWLKWLEAIYYFFPISVYSRRLTRSLKKEKKIYLYDWAEIENPGARFENLVAVHLLKAVHGYREMLGEDLKLFYLRDKEKREVDFLLTKKGKPWMMIEAKVKPEPEPASLFYFAECLQPEHVVLLTHEDVEAGWKFRHDKKYWQSSASTFFSNWL